MSARWDALVLAIVVLAIVAVVFSSRQTPTLIQSIGGYIVALTNNIVAAPAGGSST